MANELTVAQELGQKVTQFEAALIGSGIAPKKFVRVVMMAIQLNPDLLNMNRRSLMNAAMKAAADGLVPDGHDGALVPFDGQVTWMPMVAGVRKKVRRTGEVTSWDVTAVFAKDMFDFELGDSPFIKHKPYMPGPPSPQAEGEADQAYNRRVREHISHGEMTFVYSVAKLKGGDLSRDVMSRAEVELVRDTYARKNKKGEFSPAWRKSFPEMAKKTLARRHAKQLPMSSDIMSLLSRDDDLYDLERDRAERVQAPRVLSDRLDFLAGVDSETGEFPVSDDGAELPPSQRDGVTTPPSHRAAPDDDVSGVGAGGSEGAAQLSQSGAEIPPAPDGADDRPQKVVTQPEPEGPHLSGSQAPPGAAKTPSQAPGGTRKPQPSIEMRGADMAQKGRPELEKWVNELPPDEMAKISLAQLKAWRVVADKVAAT
jgi:recombination protein RecT